LPAAKSFRKWVFEEVLPNIRKKVFNGLNQLVFKIENEFDLHKKVINYIRRFHEDLLLVIGLGELQDTKNKRIQSWQKGYQKGQPDLIIQNYHKKYSGLCIEFKTPKGTGDVRPAQKELLERYAAQGYKTLIDNDYDEYCTSIRVPCSHCIKKFKSKDTLQTHLRVIHLRS
jgi:hypothetical protein